MRLSLLFLLFTVSSSAQSNIVTAGGGIQNVSYTVGSGLVELQIPIVQEVSLGVPKFEFPPEPKSVPVSKKKSFIQKLMDFIKKLINK